MLHLLISSLSYLLFLVCKASMPTKAVHASSRITR